MPVKIYKQTNLNSKSWVFREWEKQIDRLNYLEEEELRRWKIALQNSRRIPFRLLPVEELEIWKEFYDPTYYLAGNYGTGQMDDFIDPVNLEEYQLDFIPRNVLEVVLESRSYLYFDKYQIRVNHDDFILLAKNGPLDFIIARWGDLLIPYEFIKQLINQKWESNRGKDFRN
ncbi:MAG: hypothetical protein HYR80_09560 [Nitrospirae bacterium]|nr:hypothetical protein [Nitrospirota bacterium]